MNEELISFAERIFNPIFVQTVKKTFSLFEAFDHQNAYGTLFEIVIDESNSTIDDRALRFSVELASQLKYVASQHLLSLSDDASIADYLVVLEALFRLQHLEDYTEIESILSTTDDAIDQMAQILETLCEYDQGRLLTILDDVQPRALSLLKEYIETVRRMKDEPPEVIQRALVDRFRLFSQVLGEENLGSILVEAGMRLGYEIELYLPYLERKLGEGTPEEMALNILSVITISDTPSGEILKCFRDISERILPTPGIAGVVEQQMMKLLNQLEEARKVKNEQDQLSPSSAIT